MLQLSRGVAAAESAIAVAAEAAAGALQLSRGVAAAESQVRGVRAGDARDASIEPRRRRRGIRQREQLSEDRRPSFN